MCMLYTYYMHIYAYVLLNRGGRLTKVTRSDSRKESLVASPWCVSIPAADWLFPQMAMTWRVPPWTTLILTARIGEVVMIGYDYV